MYCGEEVAAIVGDIGYSNARFGFAGEDLPKAIFSGEIGRAEGLPANDPNGWAVSDAELSRPRPGLLMRHAVSAETGAVADWEAVELLWARAFEWLHARVPAKPSKTEPPGRGEGAVAGDEDALAAGEAAGETDWAVAGGYGLMAAEGMGSTLQDKRTLAELLFERFDAPAAFAAQAAALAAFAAGRSTALVLDCGGGGTSVVPVVDGYVLRRPAQRSARGGEWLTQQVLGVLERSGTPAAASLSSRLAAATTPAAAAAASASQARRSLLEVGHWVKVDLCGLPLHGGGGGGSKGGGGSALLPGSVSSAQQGHMGGGEQRLSDAELAGHLPVPGMPSEASLPDGTVVALTPALYRVPEMLFDDHPPPSPHPPSWGSTSRGGGGGGGGGPGLGPGPGGALGPPVHRLVHRCLGECDADLRKDLAGTLLLTGAGSQFKYLPERLQKEVAGLLQPQPRHPQPPPRKGQPRGGGGGGGGGGNFRVKVVCGTDPVERRFGTWVGGSILASLGSFQQMWLSKEEYLEMGPERAALRFAEST